MNSKGLRFFSLGALFLLALPGASAWAFYPSSAGYQAAPTAWQAGRYAPQWGQVSRQQQYQQGRYRPDWNRQAGFFGGYERVRAYPQMPANYYQGYRFRPLRQANTPRMAFGGPVPGYPFPANQWRPPHQPYQGRGFAPSVYVNHQPRYAGQYVVNPAPVRYAHQYRPQVAYNQRPVPAPVNVAGYRFRPLQEAYRPNNPQLPRMAFQPPRAPMGYRPQVRQHMPQPRFRPMNISPEQRDHRMMAQRILPAATPQYRPAVNKRATVTAKSTVPRKLDRYQPYQRYAFRPVNSAAGQPGARMPVLPNRRIEPPVLRSRYPQRDYTRSISTGRQAFNRNPYPSSFQEWREPHAGNTGVSGRANVTRYPGAYQVVDQDWYQIEGSPYAVDGFDSSPTMSQVDYIDHFPLME
ncbi:MAG: hypothetical protein JMN27_07370 [gamma proteobacterium endosymbiont of Lamellibrachia anaximandri]|nr:hypothetical protein [gamma proteobacterium endosymbiont of Lamellibrachia anaximandri]MBL3533638.1 hypothetical protein [gamma proteobacterium endosymbiont of Lamellibrachia anaximandri]